MKPPEQHSWMNLTELKSQIIRKLGPERSKQYFDYLNKFLSLKLSKVEFDKLCVRTVGRDGIALHNQLIRSILRNACTEKVPIGNKKPLDGVYHQNGSGPIVTHASSQLGLPNGDLLPISPRKARTGARERKVNDCKTAFGPNGKTIYSPPSSSIPHSDDFNNLNSSFPDTRKPLHHHQELISQAQNANDRVESSSQKDGKGVSNRISLHAPLGIPYYPVSTGGPRTAKFIGVSDTNCLLDTITLRTRMEQVAATQGLQGVSLDCANLLNFGLNAYLKGIIRSCTELTRPIKPGPDQFRPVNSDFKHPISLLDFRVAMELNPQLLGEDCPIHLERICTRAFEE